MLFGSLLSTLFFAATATVAVARDTKYFHEPGNTDLLGHYDSRYFKEIVDYDTRLDTLSYLMKSWLEWTNSAGIETWIAHGTLLGWWWNGKLLPWDWDIDVQVHTDTLQMLGREYNMTTQEYSTADKSINREYLLDVNAWAWERVRGDGYNIIDARWIDVRNGLYIDITGLAETEPEKAPGVLKCKNNHKYKYEELYPLRETIFEGVTAKIPYAYDDILVEEYDSKALITTEYMGHRWNPKTGIWEKAPGVPEKYIPREARLTNSHQGAETGGLFHNLYRLVHWW